MHKYWQLLKLSWQEGLAYRINVLMWRLRQFLASIMALTIWTVIFTNNTNVFGYQQSEMITYVFLVNMLQGLIFATILHGLAQQVWSGDLSKLLVKPINLYAYFATQDVADKIKNLFFIVLETVILFFIFRPEIVFPSLGVFALFIIWCLLGTVLLFWINVLFGAIGFWSPETWGPKFLFFILADFTAGKLFPLDILPKTVQNIIYLTPFPYFSFMQIQLFLQRLTPQEMLLNTGIILLWICIIAGITHRLWKQGINNYAAAGQ